MQNQAPEASKFLDSEILLNICTNLSHKRKKFFLGLAFSFCISVLAVALFIIQHVEYSERKTRNISGQNANPTSEYFLPNGKSISQEEFRDLEQSGQIEQIQNTGNIIRILKIKSP